MKSRLALLGLLVLAGSNRVQAQDDVDRGTFTITRQGAVVGRETFILKRGPTATGAPGLILTTNTTYPPDHAKVAFTAQAEYGVDSVISSLQLDGSERRLIARFAGRRVTVRVVTPATESAREYPLSGRPLAAPDSVFAFYALLRPAFPDTITAINPTTGRRTRAFVTATTTDSATVGGVRSILKHVTLGEGEDVIHLWYDHTGRLSAVEVPRLELKAQR